MPRTLQFLFAVALCIGLSTPLAASVPSLADFAKHSAHDDAEISPDGSHLAVAMRGDDGRRMLAILRLSDNQVTGVLRFQPPEEVGGFYWANDERVLVRVQRTFGALDFASPTGEIYGINEDGTREKVLMGWRAGAGGSGGRTQAAQAHFGDTRIISTLRNDRKHVLVATYKYNMGKGSIPEVLKLNIYTGRTSRVARGPMRNADFLADPKGQVRFAWAEDDDLQRHYFYRPKGRGDWQEVLVTKYGEGQMDPEAWAEGPEIYAVDDTDGKPKALVRFNAETGEKTVIYRNAIADVTPMVTRGILYGARSWPDHPRYAVIKSAGAPAETLRDLVQAFPEQIVAVTSWTDDLNQAVVYVGASDNPGQFLLYNRKEASLLPALQTMPWMQGKTLATSRPVTITARDGVVLHGYLTMPPGVGGNAPLVVHPHGGPHGPRDRNVFNPEVQVMATRGYAVLQVNFRGSGGYGSEFETMGHGKWGTEMQDDLTDATLWAVEEGFADPDRICISGASYGGYASLQGVTKEPDLYQCAVGYVGVYDLEMMFERGDIQLRNAGINYLKQVLGTDEAVLRARSPAHNVDRIKADVLLVHGGEDQRVPVQHAYRLREAMEKAGKPVEYFEAPGEAHGFQKFENRVKYFELITEFFDRHIGAPGDNLAGAR